MHHSTQHAKVGRDASLKHVAVTFGGDLVRHDATATYDGPGGSVEMLGLYFADDGQHIEHRLFVDHNQPKTRSNVVYKGALQGQGAHTVWIGNVLIRKEAEGIETYEENRNLVLTDGCQADSVPNLEIETGEIEGAGPRLGHRALRRRAAVLPALARGLRAGGPAAGRARLLQRPDPQDRRRLAAGPAPVHGRGRAGEERAQGAPRSPGVSFVRACALADVPDRRGPRGHAGRVRRRRGAPRDEVFALQDLCSHASVALSEGEVEDCTVECWLHGSRFDLRTGKPTGLPATEPVATFPVDVRDGDVYVDVTTTLNGVTPQ